MGKIAENPPMFKDEPLECPIYKAFRGQFCQ